MKLKMDLRDLPLSKRLPESIFNRIHADIGMASKCADLPNEAGIIAFNLCHFIADELDKARTAVPTSVMNKNL